MDAMAVGRGLLGLGFFIGILFLLSENRRAISWKLVGTGLLAQFIFALLILKVGWVQQIFEFLSSFFVAILNFTHEGSSFLFGPLLDTNKLGFTFAFQILPTIIFFSAITSILFYFGVLQRIIYILSWMMKKILTISGAENLSTSANIFLGQTEAPLLIKPYLLKMTRSEIFCVMVGGMANTAGGVLAAYVGFLGGSDPAAQLYFAKHLLAASVMSAPATIVIAKMMIPQTEPVSEEISVTQESLGANLLEAIANGTTDGLKLAINVGAMLIVFIALIAMVNHLLGNFVGYYTGLNEWIAEISGGKYTSFSLQFILGNLFAPLVWMVGIPAEDILRVGQLLGEKTILNEFVAYTSMAKMKAESLFVHEKSILLTTYILSGFANFASIGIQIGGIGSLAPGKKSQLAQLGIKALIGGTMATLMMATLVGMMS